MADRATSADPIRVGRGQPLHSGASDMGLLAPTPLAFGLAGAIALPASAGATEIGTGVRPSLDAAPAASSGAPALPDHSPETATSGGLTIPPVHGTEAQVAFTPPSHGATIDTLSIGTTSPLPTMFSTASVAAPSTAIPADSSQVATSGTASPAPDVSDAVSAVRASADALTGALQQLAARLEGPTSAGVEHVADTLDQVGQTLNASVDALASHADTLLDDAGMAASDLIAGTGQAVDALAGTIDTTLGSLSEQGSTLIDGATTTLGNTVEGLSQTAAGTLDAALGAASGLSAGALESVALLTGDALPDTTDLIAGAAETASAATTALLDGTGKLTSTALEDTGGIASAALDTVTATGGALAGGALSTAGSLLAEPEPSASAPDAAIDLTEIGGTDPVAGIATLTDMLSNDDSFAVVAPDAPDSAEPVFASTGDTPDALEAIVDGVTTVLDHDEGGLLDTAADTAAALLGGEKHGLSGLFDGDHGHG